MKTAGREQEGRAHRAGDEGKPCGAVEAEAGVEDVAQPLGFVEGVGDEPGGNGAGERLEDEIDGLGLVAGTVGGRKAVEVIGGSVPVVMRSLRKNGGSSERGGVKEPGAGR